MKKDELFSFDKSSGLEDFTPRLGFFFLLFPFDKSGLSVGKVEANIRLAQGEKISP